MSKSGNIFLIRHGLTNENTKGIILGESPFELNSIGATQALNCAKEFGSIPIRTIFSSPIVRADQTAKIFSKELGVPVEISEELTEVGCGDWVGKPFEAMHHTSIWPKHVENPFESHLPGWEKLTDCYRRSTSFLQKILENCEQDHIIVVSHGDIIRLMIAWALQIERRYYRRLYIDHCKVIQIKNSIFGPQVLGINCEKPILG